MATEAQIEANRANAKLSTGPKSDTGKSRVSANAVKTGLTGRTVLLPGDDLAAYQELLERVTARFQPVTGDEKVLAQRIADTEWRLARIPELSDSIQTLGLRELSSQLAKQFADVDEESRAAYLRARVYLHYRKELSNLSVQESRLRRQLEKDTKALELLLEPRREADRAAKQKRKALIDNAYNLSRKEPRTYTPDYFSKIGFDFSHEEWRSIIPDYLQNTVPIYREFSGILGQVKLKQTVEAELKRLFPDHSE